VGICETSGTVFPGWVAVLHMWAVFADVFFVIVGFLPLLLPKPYRP
jgi:hypothetical protein